MVDVQPTGQAISDDQELAKVLAGVSQQGDEGLQFEETPVAAPAEQQAQATPSIPAVPPPPAPPVPPVASGDDTSDLDGIKKDALLELRPLVDKLNISPEEKFDTYLLLIRSTDDKTLIGPAHTAAQAITDETRKAQALLDIIKEIDYLSAPQPPVS